MRPMRATAGSVKSKLRRRALMTGLVAITALVYACRAGAQTADTTTTRGREDAGSAAWDPQVLGTQIDVIGQHLQSFQSAYSGPRSLTASGSDAISHVYGIYGGAYLAFGLQGYLDVEMARGKGISHASGLAGVTNGDVLRQGTADLGNGPYVARAFVRYAHAMGGGGLDTL